MKAQFPDCVKKLICGEISSLFLLDPKQIQEILDICNQDLCNDEEPLHLIIVVELLLHNSVKVPEEFLNNICLYGWFHLFLSFFSMGLINPYHAILYASLNRYGQGYLIVGWILMNIFDSKDSINAAQAIHKNKHHIKDTDYSFLVRVLANMPLGIIQKVLSMGYLIRDSMGYSIRELYINVKVKYYLCINPNKNVRKFFKVDEFVLQMDHHESDFWDNKCYELMSNHWMSLYKNGFFNSLSEKKVEIIYNMYKYSIIDYKEIKLRMAYEMCLYPNQKDSFKFFLRYWLLSQDSLFKLFKKTFEYAKYNSLLLHVLHVISKALVEQYQEPISFQFSLKFYNIFRPPYIDIDYEDGNRYKVGRKEIYEEQFNESSLYSNGKYEYESENICLWEILSKNPKIAVEFLIEYWTQVELFLPNFARNYTLTQIHDITFALECFINRNEPKSRIIHYDTWTTTNLVHKYSIGTKFCLFNEDIVKYIFEFISPKEKFHMLHILLKGMHILLKDSKG